MLETKAKARRRRRKPPDGRRGEDDAKHALLLARDHERGRRSPRSAHGAGAERPRRGRVENPVPHRRPFAEGRRHAARQRGDDPVSARPRPRLRHIDRARPSCTRAQSETRGRWKAAYDVYFPSETDGANAIFVEVEIERMELWIRGVTPEPFGLRATVLERERRRLAFDRLLGLRAPVGRSPLVRLHACGELDRLPMRGAADRRAPIGARARRAPRA